MLDEFVATQASRRGHQGFMVGTWRGEPAILKVVAAAAPWHQPASAFFGGQGLAPPFQPLLRHEAEAWARVDPHRVLGGGQGDDGLWLLMRRRPGAVPTSETIASLDPDLLLAGLLRAVAALHAADVLHRDIRPANVLVDQDRVHLVDLDVARVAGLGPAGLVGTGRTRAPECDQGEGDGRADLYAVGRTIAALGADRLSPRGAAVLVALCADDPADRPASAADALRALGQADAPAPALSPPHPWADAWWQAERLDLDRTWESPFDAVAAVDQQDLRPGLVAAVASRMLAIAAARGGEAWLALGALCSLLHAVTTDPLYRRQAEECAERADADWHPAATALRRLADDPETDVAVASWCDLGLPGQALEEAVTARKPGPIARAAWALGDLARVDAALQAARDDDPLAVAVAASRLLLAASPDVPVPLAARALPADQLEAVRLTLARHGPGAAERLAAGLEPPLADRARLVVALAGGRRDAAIALARGLARAGCWDATVASTLAFATDLPDDLAEQARRVRAATIAPAPPVRPGASLQPALRWLARNPEDPAAWSRALAGLVRGGRWQDAGELVGLADTAHGSTPWVGLVAALLAARQWEEAARVLDLAVDRFADDTAVQLLAVAVAVGRRDMDEARQRAALLTALEPDAAGSWLASALTSPSADARARALSTARALGAAPDLVEVVELVHVRARAAPAPLQYSRASRAGGTPSR